MKHSVLACEGRHDQAALTWLARICAGWEVARDVPEHIRSVIDPEPAGGARTGPERDWQRPNYLAKAGHLLVVRRFGGKEGVLSQRTADYLSRPEALALGVVVDANDKGVDKRVESFRTTYGAAFPHAKDAEVGTVWGEKPRLGFWVAPDNESLGEMDDVLVIAARREREGLVQAGEAFIRSAEEEAPGKWVQKRNKALLGVVYQVEAPGASLASGLDKGKCWLDEDITQIEPFGKLVKFIDAIGTGEP